MIKIVQKKESTKATIKGESDDVCVEALYLIVRLVERFVEADRAFGLAVAQTVIMALKQRLPDLKDLPETDAKEEEGEDHADDVQGT